MKEIEIKAVLKNPTVIEERLHALGCQLSSSVIQKDTIFLKNGTTYDQIRPGVVVLRIREQGDKTFFTLKMRGPVELNKIEHEITVDSAHKTMELIHNLGFYEVLRINKKRRMCRYNDYTICIDEVEGLGSFIEIEAKTDVTNDQIASAQLTVFLTKLGIQPEDHVSEGYDTLLIRQRK